MTMSIDQLLIRLATELEGAAELAARVEATMDHGAHLTGQDRRNLQNLDLLTQTLADLSRFASGMAQVAPGTLVDPVAAFESLRLGAVAARLSGRHAGIEPTHGDVSVF